VYRYDRGHKIYFVTSGRGDFYKQIQRRRKASKTFVMKDYCMFVGPKREHQIVNTDPRAPVFSYVVVIPPFDIGRNDLLRETEILPSYKIPRSFKFPNEKERFDGAMIYDFKRSEFPGHKVSLFYGYLFPGQKTKPFLCLNSHAYYLVLNGNGAVCIDYGTRIGTDNLGYERVIEVRPGLMHSLENTGKGNRQTGKVVKFIAIYSPFLREQDIAFR